MKRVFLPLTFHWIKRTSCVHKSTLLLIEISKSQILKTTVTLFTSKCISWPALASCSMVRASALRQKDPGFHSGQGWNLSCRLGPWPGQYKWGRQLMDGCLKNIILMLTYVLVVTTFLCTHKPSSKFSYFWLFLFLSESGWLVCNFWNQFLKLTGYLFDHFLVL